MVDAAAAKPAPNPYMAPVRVGWGMALHDLRQRYRGSVLGPFWISANLAVLAFSVGFLWSAIFGVPFADYLPYLTTGLVVWTFIASIMTEAPGAFIGASGVVRNMPLPLSAYVLRTFFRHVIVLAHNLAVLAIVYVVAGHALSYAAVGAVVGATLVAAICLPLGLLLSVLGTRFRDVQQMISNGVQFVFFMTPVFWYAKDASERGIVVKLNPFYHLVEAFRAPLVEGRVPLESWTVCLAFALVSWTLAAAVYRAFHHRISFWV